MKKLGLTCACFLALAGCTPPSTRPPAGSSSQPAGYPATPDPSQPTNLPPPTSPSSQVSDAERWNYAWQRAMEGVAMGSAVGGPFGAGGGLVVGLIAGLLTADSHYAALNAQIQSEQEKDRQLEAQIEQELARQRELEAQLGTATADSQKEEKDDRRNDPVNHLPKSKNVPGRMASLKDRPASPQPSPPPFKNVEVKDVNQDGVPDLWVYYNPSNPAEVVRQEEDTNGNGRVDTWSAFYNGKLVRREIDSRGKGRPDRILWYEYDQLAKEERYEPDGREPSYRAFYENGRLARVEKDTTQDGRMDLWIFYDTFKENEVVLKEEKDLNGDGAIDLWSYYENGRLVRRDVSAVGLDHLRAQGNESDTSAGPEVLSRDSPKG